MAAAGPAESRYELTPELTAFISLLAFFLARLGALYGGAPRSRSMPAMLAMLILCAPGRDVRAALADEQPPAGELGTAGVSVGAIRWGGWFSGSQWAENLDDPRWHDRLPFFATQDSAEGDVDVVGDRADVMLREIEYARSAGLRFWAFCYYDERNAEFEKVCVATSPRHWTHHPASR